MSILKTDNLGLCIDDEEILVDLDIEFKEGVVQAVVGPNGAGKSSLAFSIMGLEKYRGVSGDIYFRDRLINDLSASERAELGVSLAWQEPARFEGLTVRDFIEASGDGEVDSGVFLEKLGMEPSEYLDRALNSGLSGGERKKVEMASILAMEPDLVFLDEPDSGIDVGSLERIFDSIDYLRENGTTVVLITHSEATLDESSYAYLMCGGTVIDEGPTVEIRKYFEDECMPCDVKNLPMEKESGLYGG